MICSHWLIILLKYCKILLGHWEKTQLHLDIFICSWCKITIIIAIIYALNDGIIQLGMINAKLARTMRSYDKSLKTYSFFKNSRCIGNCDWWRIENIFYFSTNSTYGILLLEILEYVIGIKSICKKWKKYLICPILVC